MEPNTVPESSNLAEVCEMLGVPKPGDLVEIRLEDHFPKWVSMGEARSFKAVAEMVNMPVSQVVAHAKSFKWRERMGLITYGAGKVTMGRLVEAVADVNEVHVTELRQLRKKAVDALNTMEITQARDAIKLLSECIKWERQILGLDEDSDQKKLAELLSEKIKKVQAKEVPEDHGGHEFQLEEDVGKQDMDGGEVEP